MKKALLAVSFGTTAPSGRGAITAWEDALRAECPDRAFYRAFSSPTIRRVLAGRGEAVPAPAEAMEELAREGFTDVAVQPGYVLCGAEYDGLKATVAAYRARFAALRLGKPLLASAEDLRAAAELLWAEYRPESGALALFGHGAAHLADMAYPALQTALRLRGVDHAFVATAEGWPTFDELLAQLRAGGYERVTLAPLMLVAGEHALKDMAGEGPESWRSRLTEAGFMVECRKRGLGELASFRALYASHLRAALEQEGGV